MATILGPFHFLDSQPPQSPLFTPQVWFKNRRVKWRKSVEKGQEVGLPRPTPAARRNTAPAPTHLAHSRLTLPKCPRPPDAGAGDCDPELDRLVATVPALSSAPYDISQVMEAYGCLGEEESSNTFTCLYQYLSQSECQPGPESG